MKTKQTTLIITALILGALPLAAQQKRVSPHETVNGNIDGNRVVITYGRPYSKAPKTGEERKIWGTLVPYGKVWRMGADEATMLTTQQPLVFGETTIPAGAYTLYMLPNEDGTAKLIFNKQVGQWGTVYEEKQDLARVDLKKEALDENIPQFTVVIAKNSSGGGVIKLSWEKTLYSVVFTVKK